MNIAGMIDATLLKPEATISEVVDLVAEAKRLGCYAVCVSPSMLPLPDEAELGDLKLATVVGFPSGAVASEIKAAEAARAVAAGADEIDMVINLGLVKEGDWDAVEFDVAVVRDAVPYATLKVIIESAALTDEEIVEASSTAMVAGADFVKTSTGYHPAGGATVHAVELIKKTVGDELGIKASGGIRDAATAQAMIDAGATRIGASNAAALLD